jgi:hypothetical protein
MVSQTRITHGENVGENFVAGLDESELRDRVKRLGLDATTRWLYDSIRESPHHRSAIEKIDLLCDLEGTVDPSVRVAIIPGFLYQEYPQSGADGRILIEATRQLGLEYDVVPMASTGRLEENATRLLRYLEERDDGPLVLASISKGGSEIAAALQMDPSAQHFAHTVGWVDVCGILRGSPVVDLVSRQHLRMLGFRALFALRRWTIESVLDLRHRDGMLSNGFEAPEHMRIVHAVGFPSEDDFVLSKLRRFHRQIGSLGPNDGAILLYDTLRAPGVVYPLRGADHYMRPRFRVEPLCRGLLRYAAGQSPSKEMP